MSRPRPRTWKRTLFMVLLLLTGGAIINVAVAWGLGATATFRSANVNDDALRAAHHLWRNAGPLTWPRDPSVSYITGDIGVLHVGMHEPARATADVWNHRLDWYMSGWPAYGMQGHCISQTGSAGGFSRNGGVLLFFDAPINLRPLWPGFAINTIFYGAIL